MTVLPEFHDQLHAAARRHARRRLPRPRIMLPRQLGTIVLTGLSTAVAIAIAVIVLTAGGGGPGSAPASKPSSVGSSRTELLHTLGALRTPQTAADRRALPYGFYGFPGQVDHPLVRTMGLASGGALTFVPMTFRQTMRHPHGFGKRVTFTLHGPRIEGLALLLRLPGTDVVGVSPSSVGVLRAQGLNVFTYVHDRNTGVVVVPDGVTKVALRYLRADIPVKVGPSAAPAETAPVQNNVAVFSLPAPTVKPRAHTPGRLGRMYSAGAYARMTWFGAQGQVLERTTIKIAFNFIARTRR